MPDHQPHLDLLRHLSRDAKECVEEAERFARSAGHCSLGPLQLLHAILTRFPKLRDRVGLSDPSLDRLQNLAATRGSGKLSAHSVLCSTISARLYSENPQELDYTIAAFEQGRPGAIMARALGVQPASVRTRAMQLWRPPGLNVPAFYDEWRFLLWCVETPDAVGGRALRELGVRSGAAAHWIEREMPATSTASGDQVTDQYVYGEMEFVRRARELFDLRVSQQYEGDILLDAVIRTPDVALLYWAQGQYPIDWVGEADIVGTRHFGTDGLLSAPGWRVACEFGHSTVRPLHLFLTGLKEPRVLMELEGVHSACRGALRQIPRSDGPHLSADARGVLQHTAELCLELGSPPRPLHLAYGALDSPEVARVVEDAGWTVEDLRRHFETILLGTLRDGRLSVDDLETGISLSELGPLREAADRFWRTANGTLVLAGEDGRVTHIRGARLERDGQPAIQLDDSYHRVENLIGLERPNHWVKVGDLQLRIEVEAGGVSAVELKR